MVTGLGPYKSIVGFNWPTNPSGFFYDYFSIRNYHTNADTRSDPVLLGDEPFETLPVETPAQSRYVSELNRGFAIPGFTGMPARTITAFDAWTYSPGGAVFAVFSSSQWTSISAQRVRPYTGTSLGYGPQVRGEYAKDSLQITVDYYLTPYLDVPKKYDLPSLISPEHLYYNAIVDAVIFTGSYNTLGNSILVATGTYDFSTVTYSGGGYQYTPIGMWVFQNTTNASYASDELSEMDIRLLFRVDY